MLSMTRQKIEREAREVACEGKLTNYKPSIKQKTRKMKKIIAFCLIAFLAISLTLTAQTVKIIPIVTLSTTDTLSGVVTKTYDRTITANYNWSVSVYWDHLSGATDSCYCYIHESVDGVHYKTVVGAVTAAFGAASATYIWSGGTGNLPVVWAPDYMRVSCSHKNTGTGRPYIKLQLKNK